MDILGYKSLVLDAIKEGRSEELLNHLHQSLREARKSITEGQTASAKVKVFTDNIVLGWPIKGDGERELGNTFLNAAFYQLQLALDGIFIRGGISNGKHYMDEETVFGPELLETYHLESEVAVYPRIILSERSKQLTKKIIVDFYGGTDSPFHSEILEDMDGEWFLNYLHAGSDTGDLGYSFVNKHKERLEDALNKYEKNHKLLKKYAWIANYHNFYCAEFMGGIFEELKVSTPIKMSQPRLISI